MEKIVSLTDINGQIKMNYQGKEVKMPTSSFCKMVDSYISKLDCAASSTLVSRDKPGEMPQDIHL